MEHEAIGRRLTEEISNNKSKIVQILTLIEQFEQGSIVFKEIIGTDFQLSISHIGVEIKALNLEADYIDNFNNNEFSGTMMIFQKTLVLLFNLKTAMKEKI